MDWMLLTAVLTLGAGDVAALTITVTVAGAKQVPDVVRATVRRIDEDNPARVVELPVGKATTVDLPGGGTWEITAASTTLWSLPVYTSGWDAVNLQLWPLGSISGKLSGRPPASGDLVVNFTASGDEAGPAGIVVCPFMGTDWRCALPAGQLDMRFNLTGFATEFRWGVKVGDTVDIGTIELTPGSSLAGKIQTGRASTPELLKSIEVTLTPVNVDPNRGGLRRHTARPDTKGFFQVRGLAPGRYSLRAQAKDLVSDTRTIDIIQQTNALLKEPLVVAKPARLSVRITPALDIHESRRWQVMLLRKHDLAASAEVVDQSLASAKGEWTLNRVFPGEYALRIQQQDGSEWKREEFTVHADDGDRLIDVVVSGHRVSGKVTLGRRPLAAKVRFGGEHGPGLTADENGLFEGVFPPFTNEEATLLVTSDIPDVKRTLVVKGERAPDGDVYFDITLPGTTIIGRTINEDGSPEPSAIVTLQSKADDRLFEQMFSEQDGTFQFEGFEAGVYALQADAFEKRSAVVEVEAGADGPSSIDVILRPVQQVRGTIWMKGVPVAGAEVYALPRDTTTSFLPHATSDATGRFVVTLPPGTKTYDAIVFPRGFYATAARMTMNPEKPDMRVEVGQDGGSLTVDAPADQAPLLLVHAGGEYHLSWVAQQSGGTVTQAEGRQRITVPNLQPGSYAVCRKQVCESVHVPRFAAASLKLTD